LKAALLPLIEIRTRRERHAAQYLSKFRRAQRMESLLRGDRRIRVLEAGVGTGGEAYPTVAMLQIRECRAATDAGSASESFIMARRHHNQLKKGLLMKFSTLYSCALLLFGLSTLANAGSKADIRQLEQEFNAAYAANDLDKYFGYYADDAVLWFPEGRTDVPSYRKMWTDYIKGGAKLQSATLSDTHIKLSPQGDTAIASYVLRVKTLEANQKVTDEMFQETDVWFKTAGAWKIAHVHYSPAPGPAHK